MSFDGRLTFWVLKVEKLKRARGLEWAFEIPEPSVYLVRDGSKYQSWTNLWDGQVAELGRTSR